MRMETNSTGYFRHVPMSLNMSRKSQEKKLNAHNEKEEDRKKYQQQNMIN